MTNLFWTTHFPIKKAAFLVFVSCVEFFSCWKCYFYVVNKTRPNSNSAKNVFNVYLKQSSDLSGVYAYRPLSMVTSSRRGCRWYRSWDGGSWRCSRSCPWHSGCSGSLEPPGRSPRGWCRGRSQAAQRFCSARCDTCTRADRCCCRGLGGRGPGDGSRSKIR